MRMGLWTNSPARALSSATFLLTHTLVSVTVDFGGKLWFTVKVAEGSGFCWEQPSREARLEFSDISGVVLRQKGFELVVHTSHATDAVS